MNKQTLRPVNLLMAAAVLSTASVAVQAATFSAPFTSAIVDSLVAGSGVSAGGADTNQVLLAGPSGTTGPLNLVKATAWKSGSDSNTSNFSKTALTDQGIGLGAGGEGFPEHAIDNIGAREFVLFEFDQAVTLNALSVSWAGERVGADSDISIAAFLGGSDAEALLAAGGTDTNDLLTSDWSRHSISNVGEGGESFTHFETAGAGGSAIASKFWAIGAYNSGFGNGWTSANDYVKLSGLGGKYTTPCYPPGSPGCAPPGGGGGGTVPEPSSITLAALGLLGGIRRWKSRKA